MWLKPLGEATVATSHGRYAMGAYSDFDFGLALRTSPSPLLANGGGCWASAGSSAVKDSALQLCPAQKRELRRSTNQRYHMQIQEIAFTGYSVTDMARAKAFYEGVLGEEISRVR